MERRLLEGLLGKVPLILRETHQRAPQDVSQEAGCLAPTAHHLYSLSMRLDKENPSPGKALSCHTEPGDPILQEQTFPYF